AISFIGVNGVARFYPPIGLHEVLPLEVASDFRGIMDGKIEMLGPEANPERRTLWTAPYEDNAGQGLVVTAETPIYEGDTFRGIIQVDLLIESLIDQIDAIRPTPGSFSFYIDAEGNPVRGAGHERIARA